MVMATDLSYAAPDSNQEDGEVEGEVVDAALLHDQLVRHVLAISGELDSRSDVWGEHSYARGRGPAANSQIRSLLPGPEHEPEPDELVDVEAEERAPPAPPLDSAPDTPDAPDANDAADDEDEWEERLAALAPSAAHARLAAAALGALRDLRLERLAGAGGRWARREGARAAARRLRRALAAQWASGAAWLHSALLAYLPRSLAPLYAEVVTELRRAVPRLADRLPAPRPPAPRRDPLSVVGERRAAGEPGPWLAWAPGACEAEDERWVRRLGALLHTRLLRPAGSPSPPASPAPPDRWCAALVHDARTALADMVTDAGRRAVIVGGAGAGAALAAWLAAGGGAAGRLRGLLALAPPLLTAEGARDCPEDVLEEVEVPMLAVVGGGAAQCWRGAAAEVACRFGEGERGDWPVRRVLLLPGADDALRLPRAHRRRLRLPQHALDAAVAEECARWAAEAAESSPRARRRAAAEREESRASNVGNRSIEIIEGRVVARVSGGSPLALAPPRRADALAAADIMQLPIVFADDALVAPDERLTVTSGDARDERRRRRGAGALKYTRVLVAKRGAAGRGGAGRGGTGRGGAGRGARPVLLRRRPRPLDH